MPETLANFSTPAPFSAAFPTTLAALILLLPLLQLVPAALARRRPAQDDLAWHLAQGLQLLALALAAATGLTVALAGSVSLTPVAGLPQVRIDVLSSLMMALASFIGWVLVRYSRRYLAGEAGRGRYLAWLCLTLISVWLLVTLNNLLLMVLAWSATSITLHQLLTFYNERPAALLAAHKKFLISRVADAFTLLATALVYLSLGTLHLDQIAQATLQGQNADIALQLAAVLFALSAILKCAQLPFHGWLLQVMEAPTPVSALLHAGIVNMGGFVLLRLSGLLDAAPLAQLLLVIAGSTTAALAALVMMTRVSIKVMLAWSTCAQMGFMLLEIGLGMYPLALLHLLAHSLYKAHAFLASGETVANQRVLALAGTTPAARAAIRLAAYVVLLAAVLLAGVAGGLNPLHEPALWVLGGTLLCGLIPLTDALAGAHMPPARRLFTVAYTAFGLTLLYCLWHRLFAQLVPVSAVPPNTAGLWFAGACLLGLTAVQQQVLGNPEGKLSRWLHPQAFAGFHLDEWFTRLTLLVWPARMRRTDRLRTAPHLLSASTSSSQENA